ncbi:PREDICTED: uncharacterized protein LOC109590775 [Amphimedon queenslandica]|uniref:Uncharacterized protein n=1 Tax=Amphimedon queenslandica TaxID=400682 RepID=A0A1X7SZ47_AMPQE|nr:PREDICTED: uncharacterized protein LOC109590775 [Amphimedon queenslandica]|eukprot:XP_019862204.1 PREDICTED: uncharacterized protein LOC109590775 [Amphimedon queenslandica]
MSALSGALVTGSRVAFSNLLDLENVILNNPENLQSLIRAYYPTNNFPSLWIKVVYNIDKPIANESSLSVTDKNESFVFYWSNSPLLLYFHPLMLQGISLQFFNQDYTSHEAQIDIPSFCAGFNRQGKIELLNDITIWLRSYASERSIKIALEGYCTFEEDAGTLKILTIRGQFNLFNLIGLSVIWFVIFSQLATFGFFWKKYDSIQRTITLDFDYQCKSQRLHFKSIFWAAVIVDGMCSIIILALDFANFLQYAQLYKDAIPLSISLLCVLIFLITINAAFSMFLTIKYYRKNKMIALPKLICCIEKKRCIQFFVQLVFLTILTLSSTLYSFHISGIIIGMLVNPTEVMSKVILIMVTIIIFFFIVAYIIEKYETGEINLFSLAYMILLTILFVTLCVQFTISYANTVLFVSLQNYDVVNILSQVFPIFIAGFVFKWVAMEYKHYRATINKVNAKEQETNKLFIKAKNRSKEDIVVQHTDHNLAISKQMEPSVTLNFYMS